MVDGLVYESLDNRFQASYILLAVDDIKASKTQRYDSGLMPKSFSIKPTSIDTVTVDGLTTLTAVGGYLGVEASLVWYKNKYGDHLMINNIAIKNEPKLMAEAIRTIMSQDEPETPKQ